LDWFFRILDFASSLEYSSEAECMITFSVSSSSCSTMVELGYRRFATGLRLVPESEPELSNYLVCLFALVFLTSSSTSV